MLQGFLGQVSGQCGENVGHRAQVLDVERLSVRADAVHENLELVPQLADAPLKLQGTDERHERLQFRDHALGQEQLPAGPDARLDEPLRGQQAVAESASPPAKVVGASLKAKEADLAGFRTGVPRPRGIAFTRASRQMLNSSKRRAWPLSLNSFSSSQSSL